MLIICIHVSPYHIYRCYMQATVNKGTFGVLTAVTYSASWLNLRLHCLTSIVSTMLTVKLRLQTHGRTQTGGGNMLHFHN